ncbi:MAG: accessory Sec system glycosyltransferase GtfA [Lachnospiraceae bacterium]
MIYCFNRGIGWASSGVEYAQAYRAKAFRNIGAPARFVFTDMFRTENMDAMTREIGFEDRQVIWLYQYFTDFHPGPCTVTEEALVESFGGRPFSRSTIQNGVQFVFQDMPNTFVNAYRSRGSGIYIQRAEHVVNGYLLRTDYYSYGKMFSEFFAPKDGKAVLYQRRFYNEDGSTAYEEFVDGDRSMFRIGEKLVDSKERLIGLLVESLHLSEQDVCICDRSTEIGRGLFSNRGSAKLWIVIHADHYSKNSTTDREILWNNYYEYDFSLAGEKGVVFISSTDAQTKLLAGQFEKYWDCRPRMATIPVGALKQLRHPAGARKPFSLITASRLAGEKHVDWIVEAVVQARKVLPELTLDIYGQGAAEGALRDQIRSEKADEYIHLCGHKNLTEVYQNYEAYISGSTSEGFGLTLMEAVGSGLAMVGFDVPYGNPTFIDDGKNGCLLPYSTDLDGKEAAKRLGEGIVRLYSMDMAALSARSYEIAEPYLECHVEARWKALLESETCGEAGQ